MNRREIIQAIALALMGTGCGCGAAMAQTRKGGGCVMTPEAFKSTVDIINVEADDPNAKDFDPRVSALYRGSSNRELDRALGRQLSRLSKEFGVRPGFGYYQDDDGMNAVATSYTRIPQTRGTVAFGLQMLSHCMKRKNGEMSVLAVCAHEFGHIKQFFEGYAEAIEQTMPGYCIELHADYMAGYYMSRHRDTYPTANLQVVGRLWSELGGGDYNRPGSHGTGAMRIDAIESGYKYAERYGKATSDDAARNGVAHVRKYARSS